MRPLIAKLGTLFKRIAALRRRKRAVFFVLGSCVALGALAFLAAGEWVKHVAEPQVFATYETVPSRTVSTTPLIPWLA